MAYIGVATRIYVLEYTTKGCYNCNQRVIALETARSLRNRPVPDLANPVTSRVIAA